MMRRLWHTLRGCPGRPRVPKRREWECRCGKRWQAEERCWFDCQHGDIFYLWNRI